MVLARCWADVSDDPIFSNNQRIKRSWSRISEKYEAVKPAGAKVRNNDQFRKHWERMKAEIGKFNSIYQNTARMWGSGQSQKDLREMAMKMLMTMTMYSQNEVPPAFKHWDAWLILKDIPEFQVVLEPNAQKRTELNISGNYNSNSGGD